MNHRLQKEIKRYVKNISKQIPKNYPNKRTLMNVLRFNLDDFLSEHPESTMDNIIEEFGSPTKIAASFMEELPEADIVATMQKRRKIFTIMFVVCFVCCIIFIFILRYVYDWYQNDALILEETLYVTDGTEFPAEWQEKFENAEGEDVYQKDID